MNYDWTPEELEIRSATAALFDDDAHTEMETLEEAPTDQVKRITGRYLKRLAGAGYADLAWGDVRSGMMSLIAAQEALAERSGSLFLAVEASARLFGGLVSRFGNADELADIMDPLRAGDIIGAVAVSEDEDPSVQVGRRTVGVEDADHVVVSGAKSFVTNAPIADFIAVVGEVLGKTAIFLIRAGSPGFTVGDRLRTVGYNGLAAAGLTLKDVRVPKSRVLGPFENDAPLRYLAAMQDVALTAASVGLMKRSIDESKRYSGGHNRGGKPVGRFQEIRFKLAEMLTVYQTSQLLLYRAGWLYGAGDPEAASVLLCAKVFAAEAAEEVSGKAMQIMAGRGYVAGNPVERAYRDAKYAAIAGTTSERARMSIADELLNKYRM